MPRLFSALIGAAVAAALFFAVAARTSAAGPTECATSGYGYAGLVSRETVHGVAATLTARSVPRVASGHAAAWVGVGGVNAGPNGAAEWIQAGIAAFPEQGLRLYFETVRPGEQRRFVDLGPARVGGAYRVSVTEVGPGRWQAFVDGRAVSRPIDLPGSSGMWRGVATAETWTSSSSPCNRFAYAFDGVAVRAAGGTWRTPARESRLEDAGMRLSSVDDSAFAAAGA